MSRTPIERSSSRRLRATVIGTVVFAACMHSPTIPTPPPAGAVSGTIRFLERPAADTAIGPVVVMLEPIDSATVGVRPAQLFRITSSTDRFHPNFSAVGAGDYVVFVNGGSVSHRLFSADLGPDVQIPLGPAASSEPQRIDRPGELRFFCSLHPDEHFSVLVTAGVFFAIVDGKGGYYVAPLPGGTYRLSIWSPRLEGQVRMVEVASGSTLVETIWLDPDLIGR